MTMRPPSSETRSDVEYQCVGRFSERLEEAQITPLAALAERASRPRAHFGVEDRNRTSSSRYGRKCGLKGNLERPEESEATAARARPSLGRARRTTRETVVAPPGLR